MLTFFAPYQQAADRHLCVVTDHAETSLDLGDQLRDAASELGTASDRMA